VAPTTVIAAGWVTAGVAAAGISSIATAQAPDGKVPIPKSKFVQGRILTDGVVTPNAPETFQISGLPARVKFQIATGPPPGAGNCNGAYACEPPILSRLTGTPRFRSSGKGRATASFIFPQGFLRYSTLDFRAPPQFIQFKNGDPVFFVLAGGKAKRKDGRPQFVLAEAVARARVQIP
jgi:hypothetical protein